MDWRTSPLIEAWWGEGRHPLCALLRIPLLPFAGIFAAATAVRGAAYARGWLRGERLPVPVISIGNLTVGGTGKTPTVRWIAEHLVLAGIRPLVFSSGFGAPAGRLGLDEEGASLSRAIPGIPLMQARDPRRALPAVFESKGGMPDAVVLDDGFQKLGIARDLDVVMLDATRPFGSSLPLPAGPLREPKNALRRASVLILSRTDLAPVEQVRALKLALESRFPGIPVLRQRHEPSGLLLSGRPPSALSGARVYLVSAIAHPKAFEATVQRLGARVLGHAAFRDHAPLPNTLVEDILARARAAGADLLLATAKDAPKLEGFGGSSPPIDALDISVAFEDDVAPLVDRMMALFDRSVHATQAHRS